MNIEAIEIPELAEAWPQDPMNDELADKDHHNLVDHPSADKNDEDYEDGNGQLFHLPFFYLVMVIF